MKKMILLITILFLLVGCVQTNNRKGFEYIEDESYAIEKINNKPLKYEVDSYNGFSSSVNIESNGGDFTYENKFDSCYFNIKNSGGNKTDIVYSQNGLYLSANQTYNVSIQINSTVEKSILIMVKDVDNQVTLYEKDYVVADDTIQFSFDTTDKVSYTGSVVVMIGGDQKTEYTFQISDVLVKPNQSNTSVKVNQIGYLTSERKTAIFSVYDGDYFDIYDASTNESVYRGTIVHKKQDSNSKEIVGFGDFSDFTSNGSYYIVSQYGNVSYLFEIADNLYDSLLKDSFKMISSQRCGYDLPESIYHYLAHPQCHTQLSNAYGLSHQLDTTGGWHDAGDYGKYTSTIAKTTIDLMMTYLVSNDSFNDDMNILESGNNINDLLDEIKVGVSYLLKLQRNDGGIYHKIVPKQFASFISPEEDFDEQYAMNVDTASTAFSGTIFAIASQLFDEIDTEYANQCKSAAELSYDFIENNNFIDADNPIEFGSGVYRDGEDVTEKYLFNLSMWYMTDDIDYVEKAWQLKKEHNFSLNLNYNNPSLYGTFLFAYHASDSNIKNEFATTIIDYANLYYENVINDPYFISLKENYSWGSNYIAANYAMTLLMGYYLSGDYKYIEASYDTLHYLLGRNALNQSYITNVGDKYPKNIHHRFTIANSVELPGALVGGPNVFRNDSITIAKFNDDTPRSKSYIDHQDSYSTNEVAIYYNSPLVFVVSALNSIRAK